MENKRLEEYCRLGEKADTELRAGRPTEALKAYDLILKAKKKHGDVDSYLVAKVTLGVLRCLVKTADLKTAFEIWNSAADQEPYGLGIFALESAQTTVHDMLTYDMLCAYLHTLEATTPNQAANAVNQYLSRVCEHAVEHGDRALLAQVLSNWKNHLRDIFQGTIPHAAAESLIGYEKEFGETVRPRPLDFPLPSPWEKPRDFREVSRIVQMKDASRILNSTRKTAV